MMSVTWRSCLSAVLKLHTTHPVTLPDGLRMPPHHELFARYRELQQYVGWTEDDALRIRSVGPRLEPSFVAIIDDFYAEIDRHPSARAVIKGGDEQVQRLKQTLRNWLSELVAGDYDETYVQRRWQVGLRHVEIGLSQVYTNVALSRLRGELLRLLPTVTEDPAAAAMSLNKLLDLDLAIIEDAYQSEYMRRQQQSDRLAAIGQVAGGIAHELRNPLNVVKTSVYYLLHAKSPTPEKVTEHLTRIERQVGVADGVISALSDFARLPVPELRPISVESCLREVLEQVPLANGIMVSLEIPASVPAMLGDERQLKIVFGNLVRNACDAMKDGGALRLTVRPLGDDVEISVTDTGGGILPENLERILEPLYSTKARGIGLGLAITRSIVEKHSGKLQVASELGQGSTFTVRLPAVLESTPS